MQASKQFFLHDLISDIKRTTDFLFTYRSCFSSTIESRVLEYIRDIPAMFKWKGQFTAAADEKINKPRGSPTGFSEPSFRPYDNAAR